MTPPTLPQSSPQSLTSALLRGTAVWLLLIIAEILHGILRAILLVPQVGEFRSNQIGVFTGSAIILIISIATTGWIAAKSRRDQLIVGFLWLMLTFTFEIAFGRWVMGLTWQRLVADYQIQEGGLMPLGLTVLLFSPMIAAHLTANSPKATPNSQS